MSWCSPATLSASSSTGWTEDLRRLAKHARPSLAVTVPLVEYRAHALLEDVVADRAWQALNGPAHRDAGTDRARNWDALLSAAAEAGHAGMVLLLDELSEFLRAKQGPALTEDLRFLQFLGEWAQSRPVVVVAALQESIEEVANVSQRELARIRDRYRPSLALSMRHVEDLVRGRLVRLRPGAEHWVRRAHEELSGSFPATPVSFEAFSRCYPLHPETLSVLEGLRFLLSQQRGVVDFVCTGLRAALDRPCTELVTPDQVYDHFSSRLHERPETARLAGTVIGYYERALDELVDADDRELALRAIKLLSLLAASPIERSRTAAELAGMLQARVSELDPSANVAYLETAVLRPLVERGAYVVARPGPPVTYEVDAGADATLVFHARVAQVRAELNGSDRRLVSTLTGLGSAPWLPFQLLAELGTARRELLWQNTLRSLLVGTTRVLELTGTEADALVDRARKIGAEGCLLVAEPELTGADAEAAQAAARAAAAGAGRLAVWVPAPLTAAEHDHLLDIHARQSVAAHARRDGHLDLAEVADRAAEPDAAVARELLRRIYFEGSVVYPPAQEQPAESPGVDLPSLAGLPFERQLPRLADPLLSGLHPLHRQVAPRGELVGDRLLRQLVHEVIPAGRIPAGVLAQGRLRPLVEGYLVPLGLARSRREGATIAPDAVRSPAVAELLRLVGDGDPIAAADVLLALADGQLGLTEAEAVLVLNACARSGLVELLRGRGQMTEPFLAVTATDQLVAGELVETAVRTAIGGLGPICGPGPFDPWTASTQRHAWQYAQAWIEGRREDLAQAQAGLSAVADIPALGQVEASGLLTDAELVAKVVEATAGAASPTAGLRALAAAVSEPEAVPASDERLAALLRQTLGLFGDALRLAAEDRTRDLFAAVGELRGAYLAAYQQAHDRHYAAVGPASVGMVRASPAYRALSCLSAIGAVAVPDDRVKVDRVLAAAAPDPCTRRLDQELAWKPLCSCGFRLGDPLPALDGAAVVALADRGVSEYLAELGQPEPRGRLELAAADLEALGRDALAGDLRRLIALAERESGDSAALVDLLGDELAGMVRDVLTGGQLIVTRDLAALREDVIGRRYPKHRLLELMTAWADPAGDVPLRGFIEVIDSSEPADAPTRPSAETGTVRFLRSRFPTVAAQLPARQGTEAFWLAAWWVGRPDAPAWLPAGLLADTGRLAEAAAAARRDPGAVAGLADLDRQAGPDSVLGAQIAAALDLPGRAAADVAAVLAGESLLRHPVRLAADQLLRRLAADWALAERLDLASVASGHALIEGGELVSLAHLRDAAGHLAQLERRLAGSSAAELIEDLYPHHIAPVAGLLSRAEMLAPSSTLIDAGTIGQIRTAARRTLAAADQGFRRHADAGFPGCLAVWDLGRSVIAPLLEVHGRVAVLLIDAMRADLAERVAVGLADVLPGRALQRRWAVVPAPSRTAEAMAAMASGRPTPAGSAGPGPIPAITSTVPAVPFAHLGYETTVLAGADRDHHAAELADLWAAGPPVSVAVATGVDERLHRTSVEPAALLDEAVAGLERRVLPSLAGLSGRVPLVVLADHGFRENPAWGRGPEGRYVHGGTSLEECVVPVIVAY